MIDSKTVAEIRTLLAEGRMSQRRIARAVGVSRGTVAAIALDRRPDYEALRAARKQDDEEPQGPLERCPGCGGLVVLPCRLCRVRRLVARRRLARPPRRQEQPLELELAAPERMRLERLKARQIRQGLRASESQLLAEAGGRPTITPLSPCGRGVGGEGAAWANHEVIAGRPLGAAR